MKFNGKLFSGMALVICLLWGSVGLAQSAYYSPTALGFSSPQSINGTPATNAMRLGLSSRGYYTRVTLVMTVVWGTTATMNVTCKVSGNGTDYGWIQACTSATPHDCGVKTWQWVVADGTTLALDFEANYPYLICQFDDPGTGNGTVTLHAITGR